MTAYAETGVGFAELIRDTRHLGARAASDLADWLAYLSVEGKADLTATAGVASIPVAHPTARGGGYGRGWCGRE